jgi:hypothetical protein
MLNRSEVSLSVLLGTLFLGSVSWGTVITVPNGSFESPSASTSFGVSSAITDWTTYGEYPFDTGGGAASSGTGIFPNVNPDSSVNFTNATGSQVAYIFTKSSIAANRDGLEQILTNTFASGKSYNLSIDVGLAGANPGATEPFTFALFYYDPSDPTARNVVGTRTIFNDGVTPLSKTSLTTYSVSTSELGIADTAVGKQIGIEICTALGSDAGVTAGKQYDFDNVQLSEAPEPGTLMLALGGMASLTLRRRKRVA